MGIYKVVLPKMGESVSEATITKWVKTVGDSVEEDDPIVEIATDKVDSDVPAPVTGTLAKICFEENQVVQVGDVIAWIEIEGEQETDLRKIDHTVDVTIADEATSSPLTGTEEEGQSTAVSTDLDDQEIQVDEIPGTELLEVPEDHTPQKTIIHSGSRFYSPLVKNIAQEEGLTQSELDGIIGTGAEGRVTKQDILDYVEKRSSHTAGGNSPSPSQESVNRTASLQSVPPESVVQKEEVKIPKDIALGDEIVEMDRMRRLIADHMVHSVKTSPHVASFVEADVTNLVNWRNKVKDGYKKREGENITFTPIFIEAISKALRDFPMVNVSIDGYQIIKKKNINIGMAAALPSGNLIVPVIKNADQLSLVGLSKSVNDLAHRSRQNQLKPDDTQGGTFTFTNIGAFGNIMGVPIINQPQAAILAVGTIKKKPAVLETEHGDVIAIRHMMYLSMSYDHRVIDGALGGTFLKRVADYLENWDVNREI